MNDATSIQEVQWPPSPRLCLDSSYGSRWQDSSPDENAGIGSPATNVLCCFATGAGARARADSTTFVSTAVCDRQATAPPAPGSSSRRPVIAPGTFFARLLDDDRLLVTADVSGHIALWSVAPPLPENPQTALVELECRSQLKVDAFGNLVWLTPDELRQKLEQLRKLRSEP